MLNKAQILAADDLPKEVVTVPEWGGEVFVRMLTGTERDRFEASLQGEKGKIDLTNVRARFCSLTMVDDAGKRLFADNEVMGLGQKSAKALDRVFGASQKLNGLTDADVEELAKNSESDPADASSSD